MPHNNIRALREARGWTQRDLAERVGVSPPAVAGWELGTRGISLKNARVLADLFGVTLETVVGPTKGG